MLKDLGNPDSVWAEYKKKSIYVKMLCDFQNPSGDTGGEFFGVLAKIPKLVE